MMADINTATFTGRLAQTLNLNAHSQALRSVRSLLPLRGEKVRTKKQQRWIGLTALRGDQQPNICQHITEKAEKSVFREDFKPVYGKIKPDRKENLLSLSLKV